MRLRSLVVAIVLLAAVSVVAYPRQALACSCLPRTIGQSDPPLDASDVPLNQAIVIQGYLDAESIKLEDASGVEVPFELNQGPIALGCSSTWAELIPKKPLAAMTRYTVRAISLSGVPHMDDRTSTTFTTGTSMLPEDVPAKPKGRASFLQRIVGPGDGCGPVKFKGCIGLEQSGDIELIARKDDDVILRLQLRELDSQFTFKVLPDCIELRRRSRTGQRSEPLTICGDDLGTRDFRESDMEGHALLCHGGVFGSPEAEESGPADDGESDESTNPAKASGDGCATLPARHARGSALFLLLVAATTLTRTRRGNR